MVDPAAVSARHVRVRTACRVAGPAVFLLGLTLAVISAASLFASAGSFEQPQYFWLGFVGLPLMFVGGVLSVIGYAGAMNAYFLREMVTTVRGHIPPCPHCRAVNAGDARFCKTCGAALGQVNNTSAMETPE